MIAFLTVGGIGLGLLVISMALGEILDAFDGFSDWLSGVALGVGGSLFGAGGAIVLMSGGPMWLAYAVASILAFAGLALGVALKSWVARITTKVEYEAVGLTGIAISDINSTLGKVQLSHAQEINHRLAISDSPITSGTQITVVAEIGDRVKVAATKNESEA